MKKNSLWSQGGNRTGPGKEVGKEESLQQLLQHSGILQCPVLLAQGWRRVSGMLQTSTARQGKAGNLGAQRLCWSEGVFWEVAGSPLQSQCMNPGPNDVLFETLPSPAVMHWLVTKKHTVQDKGFWQPHMDIKYCTMWGFIVWLH